MKYYLNKRNPPEKENNVTGCIDRVAIFIMLCLMLLGPILWALGYGGK